MQIVVKFNQKELSVFAIMLNILTKKLGWTMNTSDKEEKETCLKQFIDTCPDDFTSRMSNISDYRLWLRNLKKHDYECDEGAVMDFMTAHIMALGERKD